MMDSGDFKSGRPELLDAPVTEMNRTEMREDPSSALNRDEAYVNKGDQKRNLIEDTSNEGVEPMTKKQKSDIQNSEETLRLGESEEFDREEGDDPERKQPVIEDDLAPIPAATEGISTYGENDVLSGRGGGTVRLMDDLINLHRRAYLKARKNDKPAISRAIVRSIRESNGKFLKKDEKSGLWFEIGDDAAREKTSQALRQRAPEMRKLLFDAEVEEARIAVEQNQQQQQQRMMMAMPGMSNGQMPMQGNPMLNPHAFMASMANKGGNLHGNGQHQQDAYNMQPMFHGGMYPSNGMNRFHPANPNAS
eukprot:scaffold23831_cov180-Amphora_coffeaeformis.AAC.3